VYDRFLQSVPQKHKLMKPLLRKTVIRALALLLALGAVCAWAATPLAGTAIHNVAKVTYRDTATGFVSTLNSNEVSAVIDLVEALQLTGDQTVTRAPGSSFQMLHRLTNTGTAATSYAVTVAPVAGAAFSVQALITYWDQNLNSKADPGEQALAPGFSVLLQPGESAQFLIYGVVPATATSGQVTRLQIAATSATQGAQQSNTDTIIAQADVVSLQLLKTASTLNPLPGSTVTFSIEASNNGSADATGTLITVDGKPQNSVVLRDAIPANTSLSGITATGGGQTLFHIAGDPPQSYTSTPPPRLDSVDAVAFAFSQITVGQVIQVGFNVAVAANASGSIVNTAMGYAANNLQVPSNQVVLSLPVLPPTLAFYTDTTYTRTASFAVVGQPLYLQANASQCNMDPQRAETHNITVASSAANDLETFVAVESGPNTGIFRILPNVPTRDARTNAAVAGNATLEVLPGDQVIATLQGCGAASVQATILIDPGGIVFDSRTNAPIAGATLTLIDVSGAANGGHPGEPAQVYGPDGVTASANPIVSGADGHFEFGVIQPSRYKLQVSPPAGFMFPSALPTTQLPVGRHVDADASYAREFVVSSTSAPLRFDVPLDRIALGAMLVEKTASRATAEIGDFLDYTIRVKNTSPALLQNLKVNDTLPRGFSYQPGTTRINGSAAADPSGGRGPALQFVLDTVQPNGQSELKYRVRVGPNAVLGDALNRAVATDGITSSNVASAKVTILGGVFAPEGFIVGKVFADCNGNFKQDAGEPGIPGVKVMLEDQTYAITDGEGKYSLYGVAARTHVLKIDRQSLPKSFHAVPLSHRNAGDGETLFIDLKNGEMFKADFATACSVALRTEIDERRRVLNGMPKTETDALLGTTFNYETLRRSQTESKAAGASGVVGAAAAMPAAGGDIAVRNSASNLAPAVAQPAAARTEIAAFKSGEETGSKLALVKLEELIPKLDNKVGFAELNEGQILPVAQATIRVKGPAGSVFKLFANGEEVKQSRVGKKVSLADHNVEAWEFVGVELKPGANRLQVVQFDQFGNERGRAETSVVTPKDLKQIRLEGPKEAVADGKTPVKIRIRLLDEDGIPVTVQTPITLSATNGEWQVRDLDPREPGIQTFVRDGEAEFLLKPPAEPGTSKFSASNGLAKSEASIDFVPELRPMIVAGVVDQIISFRNVSGSGASSANAVFEQQLRQIGDASAALQSHAGVSLKGTVKGSYLVTAAYDSDKQSNTALFRDMQPDQYYAIYGDSSTRGYDAQSTSRAYLRVDKGKNYLLYGDFATQDANPARFLSVYTRSTTGVKEHYQNGFANITAFASHESQKQQVEELPANGTSGPYILKYANGLVNSETVEILIRDRNQPALVLKAVPQTRFSDYEFEPHTGRIIFKAPVASFDPNLNPVSIRVTYELDLGGEKFWLTGIESNFKINSKTEIGGLYIADMNPTDQFRLTGINSSIKIDAHTVVRSEFARTSKDSVGEGTGYRFELQHEGADLKARAYFGRTSSQFDNLNALLNKGRGEGGLKLSWKLNNTTRMVADAIRSEDASTRGTQVGALAGVEHTLPGHAQLELGVRYVENSVQPASTVTAAAAGTDSTSIRTKLMLPVPYLPKMQSYGEFEQDIRDADKRMFAVGATYQLMAHGKLYARHELMSSLSQFSLNSQQQQAVTVFGIDTDYRKNSHAFSEYRGRDAFSGRETEAAIGVRNVWTLRPGLRINTGLESVQVLKGSGATDAIAVTSGVEYTASPVWKGTERLEWRGTANSQSFLSTLGAAVKLSPAWSLLGRNVFNITTTTSGPKNDQQRNRMQLGFAYRDSLTNVWNALAMVEFKAEKNVSTTDLTDRKVAVISANFNVQPTTRVMLSTRYATRFTAENSSNLYSDAADHLISGRVTYDLKAKWDVGMQVMTGLSRGFTSQNYGIGWELGRMLAKNLWLSAGYNVVGFRDADLASETETNRGGYIRFRCKFDERTFSRRGEK
jgi:uncharacterized repeat protein (TIGR01451 family)